MDEREDPLILYWSEFFSKHRQATLDTESALKHRGYHVQIPPVVQNTKAFWQASITSISVGRSPDYQAALHNTTVPSTWQDEPKHRASLIFHNGRIISRFGTQIKLSRFATLVRRNYILLIKTSLYICELFWLSVGLCWCILRVILLGRISSNSLFLKWQYSSIGPQIMTNFVKIGTKKSPQSGKLIAASIDYWFLTLLHFNLLLQSSTLNCKPQKLVVGAAGNSRFYL
jgi:hypothetical protein